MFQYNRVPQAFFGNLGGVGDILMLNYFRPDFGWDGRRRAPRYAFQLGGPLVLAGQPAQGTPFAPPAPAQEDDLPGGFDDDDDDGNEPMTGMEEPSTAPSSTSNPAPLPPAGVVAPAAGTVAVPDAVYNTGRTHVRSPWDFDTPKSAAYTPTTPKGTKWWAKYTGAEFAALKKDVRLRWAHICRIMETSLGMERPVGQQCERCARMGLECWVYIPQAPEGVNYVSDACARCRATSNRRGGCSLVH